MQTAGSHCPTPDGCLEGSVVLGGSGLGTHLDLVQIAQGISDVQRPILCRCATHGGRRMMDRWGRGSGKVEPRGGLGDPRGVQL